jgi:malto-oligosyltrehalose synthase
VQLHAGFTLPDALDIVPYLDALGISHLYTSPIFAARPGSKHGYDIVDPGRINPELGREGDLVALSDELHRRGMGLLLDIVPNHMGIAPENAYWQDVLAKGQQSRYAKWFDIAWDMHEDRKLVLPFLADENAEPEEHEHYRLVHWRKGAREINYRRFFDVNDLVGLRMEDPEVFRETHEYLFALIGRGFVDGLRVDHIDGLRDPAGYLGKLREETDRLRDGGIPIFVEKILMGDERLRTSWPIEGTTGYERLNDIENLFVDPTGFAWLEEKYRARRRSRDLTFSGTVRADKRAVLDRAFGAEVARLSRLLSRIICAGGENVSPAQIFHGIEEFVAAMPVYRTYFVPVVTLSEAKGLISPSTVRPLRGAQGDNQDFAVLDSMPLVDAETVANRIRDLMREGASSPDPAEFIARMQQLTGPAMAKGLEDTAHYAYVPLVSRNEVGGSPERPLENVVSRFHEANEWFATHFPHSLVTTSTHDTKRSGDVRARISVLSEIDREWERTIVRWRRLNRRHQKAVRGRIVPDSNAELLLYQTLVGVWPASAKRIKRYMLKAVREAKLRTSWTEPNEAYEEALLAFVDAIIGGSPDEPFCADLARFVERITPMAEWNSRARVLLHLTMPGTPDLYQGDETWNFTLVDPDNRQPVKYPPAESSKSALTRRILEIRRAHPDLFADGSYIPLTITGAHATNVIAFERRLEGKCAIVVAPRLTGSVDDWAGTAIEVDAISGDLRCALTGETPIVHNGQIEMTGIPFHFFVPNELSSLKNLIRRQELDTHIDDQNGYPSPI